MTNDYRLKSNTTATLEHESPGRNVICGMTAMREAEALVKKIRLSSALLLKPSEKC